MKCARCETEGIKAGGSVTLFFVRTALCNNCWIEIWDELSQDPVHAELSELRVEYDLLKMQSAFQGAYPKTVEEEEKAEARREQCKRIPMQMMKLEVEMSKRVVKKLPSFGQEIGEFE